MGGTRATQFVSFRPQDETLMPRWRVEFTSKPLQHFGTVEADNERAALEEAIKRFQVRLALRSKNRGDEGEGIEKPPTTSAAGAEEN